MMYKTKKPKRARVVKSFNYQTGKRKSLKIDRMKKAKLPGKRVSSSGATYWESRRNRSDLKGKKI